MPASAFAENVRTSPSTSNGWRPGAQKGRRGLVGADATVAILTPSPLAGEGRGGGDRSSAHLSVSWSWNSASTAGVNRDSNGRRPMNDQITEEWTARPTPSAPPLADAPRATLTAATIAPNTTPCNSLP